VARELSFSAMNMHVMILEQAAFISNVSSVPNQSCHQAALTQQSSSSSVFFFPIQHCVLLTTISFQPTFPARAVQI
jgi:hypothetical protein